MDNNKEDIIKQATKAEARMFRGLMQRKFYRNPSRVILALLWTFLWLIVGGVSLIALSVLLVKGISLKERFDAIIIPSIFLGLFAFLCLGLSLKLLKRLVTVIRNQDKTWRSKIIPWLLILVSLTILIFVLTFQSLMKSHFTF